MLRRSSAIPKPRRGFFIKSLLFFTIFLCLTILQLFLFTYFENNFCVFKDNVILCAISFGVGLFHFLLYFVVDSIRLIKIVNWLVAFFIVECLTLSVVATVMSFSFFQLLSSILTALCLVILFFVIAALITHDFTLDVLFLYVFSYVFCIGTIYFLTLYVVDRASFAVFICLGIITLIVYMFNIYFAQCIMGGRYTEIRLTDYVLAALTMYVNFYLLLLISINFVPLIVAAIAKSVK